MDTDLLTMPPAIAPEDSDEERKRRLLTSAQGMPAATPPAAAATPASTPTMPPATSAPSSRSEAFSKPSMPPAYAEPSAMWKPSDSAAPTPLAPSDQKMPATAIPEQYRTGDLTKRTPDFAGLKDSPTMPAAPVGLATQRFEDMQSEQRPELHGWKKALDVAGSLFRVGQGIEQQIPGTPQQFDAKMRDAALRAATEQGIEGKQQTLESGAAQAKFDTPEKREKYMEAHPDQFEGVSDFQKNDWKLSGKFPQKEPAEPKLGNLQQDYADAVADAQKRGVDPAKDDKVQQLQDAITSLQKPTAAPKDNKAVAGTIAGSPSWGVQTEKGWVDPQTQKPIPNFKPAPNYAQTAGNIRTTNVIRDGQLMAIHPDELQQGDVLASASAGEHAMSKQAQFEEIHSAIKKAGDAIDKLDKPLTARQVGTLTLAMRHNDNPTVFQNELKDFLGSEDLTPDQQDLVVWLGQLNERALSLRNVAGMGQGSDSMRAAIQATLPNIASGNKEMMKKQLAAFENQATLLEKGVPKMAGGKSSGPKAGDIEGGYRFKGGDASKKENWEKATAQ